MQNLCNDISHLLSAMALLLHLAVAKSIYFRTFVLFECNPFAIVSILTINLLPMPTLFRLIPLLVIALLSLSCRSDRASIAVVEQVLTSVEDHPSESLEFIRSVSPESLRGDYDIEVFNINTGDFWYASYSGVGSTEVYASDDSGTYIISIDTDKASYTGEFVL